MSTLSFRKNGRSIGLVAAGLVAGAVLAGAFAANAADDNSTASPSPSSSSSSSSGKANRPANPNAGDQSKPQRSDETLLTGDTAQSVKDAVTAKYPGATFLRVETDSDGVYEAHITKADGTPATVELDKNFAITGEEAGGPGGGEHGGPGGHGGRGGHDGQGRPGDNDADDAGNQAPASPEAPTTAS